MGTLWQCSACLVSQRQHQQAMPMADTPQMHTKPLVVHAWRTQCFPESCVLKCLIGQPRRGQQCMRSCKLSRVHEGSLTGGLALHVRLTCGRSFRMDSAKRVPFSPWADTSQASETKHHAGNAAHHLAGAGLQCCGNTVIRSAPLDSKPYQSLVNAGAKSQASSWSYTEP